MKRAISFVIGMMILAFFSAAQATPLPVGTLSEKGKKIESTTIGFSQTIKIIGPHHKVETTVNQGKILESVYKEKNGFLDFVYQVKVTKGEVDELAVNHFAGFSVSVFESGKSSLVPVASVGRSPKGDEIDFQFGTGKLKAGKESVELIVRTNATESTLGGLELTFPKVNGFTNVLPASGLFAPEDDPPPPHRQGAPATPEPGSLLLLAGLSAGMGGAALRRRWKGSTGVERL